ncbi:tRNA (adenosine(37)-N6)-threonylcarbamoyltransferase complex dimerization subunit type 1 TsaB [Arachidicoccus soli]|uniref:tRNA (Adenosine(37)-N6)-threonylcarbamoyltransferase complex dimerization subunit type 1 TsaB n=1 Tax=Arachidicoccus soli TaxID=2341117 RepID=A0A386HKT1_9BACT|nr:tRNA (adenosine(37)-N6)-threonylcarbamoyltransferase complex dimerization subunit type 1 TsaB [Arachidicoccus soli]AYD46229.1 tRNA (adenosine(37)-N6)-threonylcarbamoyltransferase complex dimerization subunit type 1 TsaB [Arachidicoccus soli]
MALILSLDAATSSATVCLGKDQQLLATECNTEQKDHAAFLQKAIEEVFSKSKQKLKDIDAIAVSAGPGSYTGLRVGLASAKGLCYTLNKPLILLNTLQILAADAILEMNNPEALYCPMIDARRMEVFSALFSNQLNEVMTTNTFILTEEAFKEELDKTSKQIIFTGSGVEKWQKIAPKENYIFLQQTTPSAKSLNNLAQENYNQQRFADIAYSEPLYFKPFYTTAKTTS